MIHKFLFTGDESYLLQQELSKRKAAFITKYGDQALYEFKDDNMDKHMIRDVLLGGGMFSAKKLIIIHNVPKDTDESRKTAAAQQTAVEEIVTKNRTHIPEDHVVILVCYKPDKRTKGRKFFEQNAEVKSFSAYNEKQRDEFAATQLWTLLSSWQRQFFLQLVWNNLRNIVHEAQKLTTYALFHKRTQLTDEEVRLIVFAQGEINGFIILDTLFTNPKATIEYLTNLQQQGEDMFQILGMLYRGTKLVLQIIDCYEHGIKQGKEIAATLKAHPFAVAKQLKYISTLLDKQGAISSFYKQLLALDEAIKTGKLPAEWFWLHLKCLLYRFA